MIGDQEIRIDASGKIYQFSPHKSHQAEISAEQLAAQLVETNARSEKRRRKLVVVEGERAQAAGVVQRLRRQITELQSVSLGDLSAIDLAARLLPHAEYQKLAIRIMTGNTGPARAFMAIDAVLSHLVQGVRIQAQDTTSGVLRYLATQPAFQQLLTVAVDKARSQMVQSVGAISTALSRMRKLAVGTKKTEYKRAFRSLLSVVASTTTRAQVIQLFSTPTLTLTQHDVRQARQHAEREFAGAAVAPTTFTQVSGRVGQKTVLHMLGYRVRHDVVDINAASIKNSSAGKIFQRKNVRWRQFKKYVAECAAEGIAPYCRRMFDKILGASVFCDKEVQLACCSTCVDYGHDTLVRIEALAKEMAMNLDGSEEMLADVKGLITAVRLFYEGGECVRHFGRDDGCATHDMAYALSPRKDQEKKDHAAYAEPTKHTNHTMSCPSCNCIPYLEDSLLFLLRRVQESPAGDSLAGRIDDWEHDIKECCGMLGLQRWAGHLLRDSQQHKARLDIMEEMDIYTCYVDDDYWAKVSRMKAMKKKTEAYADAKMSVHGTAVCIKVPPRDTAGIDWTNFPKDAVPGKFLWFNVLIACDKSKQTASQTLDTQFCYLSIIKKLFPHIEACYRQSDNASNYNCTTALLGNALMGEWTKIKVLCHCRDEPGEGKGPSGCSMHIYLPRSISPSLFPVRRPTGIVDMKCSHCKNYCWRSVKNGLGSIVDAVSLINCINDNGGMAGCIGVVLDGKTLTAERANDDKVGTYDGITKHRCETYTYDDDGALLCAKHSARDPETFHSRPPELSALETFRPCPTAGKCTGITLRLNWRMGPGKKEEYVKLESLWGAKGKPSKPTVKYDIPMLPSVFKGSMLVKGARCEMGLFVRRRHLAAR